VLVDVLVGAMGVPEAVLVGTGVLVGTPVLVGVLEGGTGVAAGTWVLVGGMGVLDGVAVGTGVLVGGTGVLVLEGGRPALVGVLEGGTDVLVGTLVLVLVLAGVDGVVTVTTVEPLPKVVPSLSTTSAWTVYCPLWPKAQVAVLAACGPISYVPSSSQSKANCSGCGVPVPVLMPPTLMVALVPAGTGPSLVTLGVGTISTAPLSQRVPCGRGTPRASALTVLP
jgi:hypothetical protein